MAIHENFEATKAADTLTESSLSTQATYPMERTDPSQSKRDHKQQTDGLVGKGVLPPVEFLEATSDTRAGRAAVPKRVAEAPEKYGVKTEASIRTMGVVDAGIDNSKLSAADKQVARSIAGSIAEGDTGKLQDVIDSLSKTKEGRQRLTKIVGQLNDIYDNGGIKDLRLEYPLKDENGTHWELQVSGKSKHGTAVYVYLK